MIDQGRSWAQGIKDGNMFTLEIDGQGELTFPAAETPEECAACWARLYPEDIGKIAKVKKHLPGSSIGGSFVKVVRNIQIEDTGYSAPEKALRGLWNKQGVPKEKQDELIRQVGEKAKPGAKIGPFII